MKRFEYNHITGERTEIAQSTYKDAAGLPRVLDTGETPPVDYVAVSIDEFETLRIAANQPTPKQELASLDTQYALTQRNLREFMLLVAQAMKQGTPIDISVIPGMQTVAAVEAQAAVLRGQL